MIRGEVKAFIRCPTSNSCKNCPYGINTTDRKPPIISLDKMMEDAYETGNYDKICGTPMEDAGEYLLLLDSLHAAMDPVDERLMKAFEMKELEGYPVQEIAELLHCSQARIYQLVTRAKEIARELLTDNE